MTSPCFTLLFILRSIVLWDALFTIVKQGLWPQIVHKVMGAGIDRTYCWLDLEVL